MRLRLLLIWLMLNLFVNDSSAQNKYNNNWYFGYKAAISFNSVPAVSKSDNPMISTHCASSVSDPVTGNLLFYTNGNSFWNNKGVMIDSSIQGIGTFDVLIIPLKQFHNRFIVF